MEHTHLAGHIRGSFTGAVTDQLGLFESANRGTFFIDEIGLATPSVQAVLLELLSDGQLRRLGDTRPRQVDARVIAATNADLDEMIAQNTFRADLRDRLGYLVLHMPPLAARRDEILRLATRFLNRSGQSLSWDGYPCCRRACATVWSVRPGRATFASSSRSAGTCCSRGTGPTCLPGPPPDRVPQKPGPHAEAPDHGQGNQMALHEHGGNRTQAARAVGISREHLQRRIRPA